MLISREPSLLGLTSCIFSYQTYDKFEKVSSFKAKNIISSLKSYYYNLN